MSKQGPIKINGDIWQTIATGLLNGVKLSESQRLAMLTEALCSNPVYTMVPFLPVMLSLDKHPYSLHNHFPFEVIFQTHMPLKMIMKTGRQCSKTNRIGSLNKVYLSNGQLIAGEKLEIGDTVLSMDETTRTMVAAKVTDKIQSPPKKILKITTRMGAILEPATTHPFYKLSGWTKAGDLKVKDRIAAVRCGGFFENKVIDKNRIKLTAYMLGDGHFTTRSGLGFTNASAECLTDYEKAIAEIGDGFNKQSTPSKAWQLKVSGSVLKSWLTEDELMDKYSYEKFIPRWVYTLSKEDTALFISRLWATDGMIKHNGFAPQISYCSTSRELVYGLKSLLTKFGIPTSIKCRETGYKKDGVYKRCRDAYILRVETQEGWKTFLDTFDVPGKPRIVYPDIRSNNNRHTIPIEVNAWIAELAEATVWTHTDSLMASGLRHKPKYALTYDKLDEYIEYFDRVNPDHPRLKDLKSLRDGDVMWDEVVKIEDMGEGECWDIEVEGTHNYVLDGVVTHNSTSIAAHGILLAAMAPGRNRKFDTLYVTPLFEQIRRFSNNYVRPLIMDSPIKPLLISTSTENSVLQRSFRNGSIMHFSYAGLTADRTRGIRADRCAFDEVQDIDPDHFKVIEECMSHSEWGITQYTGTPKTRDNTIETYWQQSSQAEWVIRCQRCNADNIPSMEYHLDKMIGPYHDNISEECPGTICYKCGRPISPRHGRWQHRYPDMKHVFAGYHVPQIIMPVHYSQPDKWSVLLSKRDSSSPATFYNEILGESYDVATKLVTKTELEKAGCLHQNNEDEAVLLMGQYVQRVLAVDWGGGGDDGVSYTAMAILGLRTDGKIDCIFGKKSMTPHDHVAEARECKRLFQKFHCAVLAHDYTGAGSLRETLLIQTGMALERLMPVQYVRTAAHNILTFIPATDQHPRGHYRVDKARSLQTTCYAIKLGQIRFFDYDGRNPGNPGLMDDFLALIENKVPTAHGSDVYTIQRNPLLSDDFAQAVNIGCCALWHMHNAWPNFSYIESKWRSDQKALDAMGPVDNNPWLDPGYGSGW